MSGEVVDLEQKFAAFSDHWRPRVAARLNGQDVRLVKVQGVFPWHRHPEADELTTRLLVSSLIGGLVVLHTRWLAATDGSADTASRAVWEELLNQLIRRTRDGYGLTDPLGAQTF